MICPKVPGTGIIPSGECLGDPVVLWVRVLSCFFAFELEARLVFVHFGTTTRCEVTGWCCDQPRHFTPLMHFCLPKKETTFQFVESCIFFTINRAPQPISSIYTIGAWHVLCSCARACAQSARKFLRSGRVRTQIFRHSGHTPRTYFSPGRTKNICYRNLYSSPWRSKFADVTLTSI